MLRKYGIFLTYILTLLKIWFIWILLTWNDENGLEWMENGKDLLVLSYGMLFLIFS